MSALHSPPPSQSSKQWWSRVPTTKASTVSYRPPKISTNIIPQQQAKASPTMEEKPAGRQRANSTRKFNTLASVMGFRSKKGLHIPWGADVPSGPVSPPLPLQTPPASAPLPVRTIKISTTSASSSICGPLSPGEPSIFTLPSSDDASELLTPDGSRHRTSYQPSIFTFAEQDRHGGVGLGEGLGSRYFVPKTNRLSVVSDPSIVEPHADDSVSQSPTSRIQPSYYPLRVDSKSYKKVGVTSPAIVHRRKSSGESRDFLAREYKASGFRTREKRRSDTSIPAVPKAAVSRSVGQAPRKTPSALASNSRISASSVPSPRDGDVRSSVHGSQTSSQEFTSIFTPDTDDEGEVLKSIKDEIASAHESFVDDSASVHSQFRLTPVSPASYAQPKSPVVSRSGSNVSRGPSPSVVTSLPSPTSVLSQSASGSASPILISPGTLSKSTSSSSLHRKPSSVRLRPVPPSRTPPPMADLPPTPTSQPPSPLTFRLPKTLSSTSLLNSTLTTLSEGGDASLLAFDLPPSTPSSESESSSASLRFAYPDPVTDLEMDEPILPPSSMRREMHMHIEARKSSSSNFSSSRMPAKLSRVAREDSGSVRAPSHHSSNPSTTSSQRNNSSGRGETPTPRSLRKSFSQTSISVNIGLGGHRERARVDSSTSASSSLHPSEESAGNSVHYTVSSIGRALRKQRSLANTRSPGSMLVPPMPPPALRHASSFNTSTDGSSDRKVSLSTPPSTATSVSTPRTTSSSRLNSPSTPPTQRKRMLFRDRRDSSQTQNERDREEVRELHASKKSYHGQPAGLGISLNLFSNPFSPSSSASQIHCNDRPADAHMDKRPMSPARSYSDSPPPGSPIVNTTPPIDQHILPPAELLSQMEALADMEEPSSPLLFKDRSFDLGDEDEWSMDSSSAADTKSLRSNVGSVSGISITFGQSNATSSATSSPSLIARQVSTPMPSIQGRLQGVQGGQRPSSASKIPARRSSLIGDTKNARPSTAQTYQERASLLEQQPLRRTSYGTSNGVDFMSTALPPPPRRQGSAVHPLRESYRDDDEDDVMSTLYTPSLHSTVRQVQRQASHDTLPFNSNRGSIFRKPSFLNIDDDYGENMAIGLGTVPVPEDEEPEDSFLILERGKDSIDIRRSFDDTEDYL